MSQGFTSNRAPGFVSVVIDGQGGIPSSGSTEYDLIPSLSYGIIFTDWYCKGAPDQTGSIQFDILKNGVSVIGGGTKPFITAANSNSDDNDWDDNDFNIGDRISCKIDSVSTFTRCVLQLNGIKYGI